ncbi:hypothetical protein LJC16_01685 [Bacteroidales bacterium OttesenSCG-928-C19]|nr:hypothetical protein [Bacteroidales bacterium OttesenSCG-928-C19]
MMSNIRLHKEFVKALQAKIPHKSELINIISDTLCIEKEPAARRLNEKVQFSVHEMGILAKKFGISLDSLLYDDNKSYWVPLILESPLGAKSMDVLYDITDAWLNRMADIAQEPVEFGTVFNTLPIEFYMHHPYLMKFMFFKWGHYFVGTDEFNNFSQWQLPERMSNLKEKVESVLTACEHTLYIWDESLIWTFVNEINYFYKMNIINDEDLKNIKSDLKQQLMNLEKYTGGISTPEKSSKNLSFYVSNMNLGVSAHYLFSEKKKLYNFKTNFTFVSSDNNNYGEHDEIKKWIHSFKNISVLISGSGPLERKLFFMKQHRIIDEFLVIK